LSVARLLDTSAFHSPAEDMSKRSRKVAGALACALIVTGIGNAPAADRTFKLAMAAASAVALDACGKVSHAAIGSKSKDALHATLSSG